MNLTYKNRDKKDRIKYNQTEFCNMKKGHTSAHVDFVPRIQARLSFNSQSIRIVQIVVYLCNNENLINYYFSNKIFLTNIRLRS